MPDTCTPITLYAGPADCLDRDCDEYATEDGDERDIDHCSHVTPEQACEKHSKFADNEVCTHAEPWPCQHAAAAPTR
jgi:hypothetical protein